MIAETRSRLAEKQALVASLAGEVDKMRNIFAKVVRKVEENRQRRAELERQQQEEVGELSGSACPSALICPSRTTAS